jgi:hypothetical protein
VPIAEEHLRDRTATASADHFVLHAERAHIDFFVRTPLPSSKRLALR